MHYYRTPRTFQARRYAAAAAADMGYFEGIPLKPVRAKRSVALPTDWDDNTKSIMGDRTWKRHRPAQFH